MDRYSLSPVLFAATIAGNAIAATGNLVVFDDATGMVDAIARAMSSFQ